MKPKSKFFITIFLCLLAISTLDSQSNLISSGGEGNGSGGSVSYSIGQPFYRSHGTSNRVFEGIQMPNVSAVLPIELSYFEANVLKNKTVRLFWQTSLEINNDFFTIESSDDAITWKIVEIVEASGNSEHEISYETLDPAPFSGLSYYRLKQTDYNGEYSYSALRQVEIEEVSIQIYPNPATRFISLLNLQDDNVFISIYNNQGTLIQSHRNTKPGQQLKINSLAPGLYNLRVSNKQNKIQTIHFVKI